MKVFLTVLFSVLGWICFLADYPAYGEPSKTDNEQIEPYLNKLQANIAEEEKAVESLKKKYEDILRKKKEPKENKGQEEENKKPEAAQAEMADAKAKLKDLELAGYSLKQKNQELLNSLEQSIASIHKKNMTIEELRKAQPLPPKEEAISPKSSREDDYLKKEAAVRKQLDESRKEKAALKAQLKALKEEHKSLLARKTVWPEPLPDEGVNEEQEKEIKENICSKKSLDYKKLENERVSCFDASQKNKTGLLKGFLDQAKKIDSWWREKVW
ncbi:MAG: hypothetical protein AABZ27_07110 [Candidatus Omnitrophota bacterium]